VLVGFTATLLKITALTNISKILYVDLVWSGFTYLNPESGKKFITVHTCNNRKDETQTLVEFWTKKAAGLCHLTELLKKA